MCSWSSTILDSKSSSGLRTRNVVRVNGSSYRCLSETGTGGAQTLFHSRLSALDLNGALDTSWTVPITPIYNGVWVVARDSLGKLWVGGEFKKVGGTWSGDETNVCDNGRPTARNQVSRTYLARF